MGPIFALALFGAASYGSGAYITKNGLESKDLTARIGGIPAVPLLAGLGVVGALLAASTGGWLFPIAAGLFSGALVGGHGVSATKAGLEAQVKAAVQAAIRDGGGPTPPAPPALPGPDMDAPGTEPANAPGAGWLNRLLQPFRNPANAPA